MSQPVVRRRGTPIALRRFGASTSGDADGGTTVTEPWPPRALLSSVHWSLGFIAFLVYTFVVTSYRLPLGTAAMVTALLTLPLERSFRLSPVIGWAAALLAWAAVGWSTTDYPTTVSNALIDFAKVCAVVFVAVNVITTRARLRVFLVVFLGTFALYPVRGALFAYFIYGGTIMGRAAWNFIYSNPNDLAGFCLLQFSLAAGLAATERARWIQLAARAGMGVLPFLIVLTGSRAGFIALIAFTLLAFHKQVARFKAVLALAVIGMMIAVFVPDNVWRRIGTIGKVDQATTASQEEDQSSTAQRLEIWKVATTVIAENPVTGVGLGAYPSAHFVYSQRSQFDRTALGHRDAHSTYLLLAAELGVPGFLLFAGLVAATLLDAERTRRRRRKSYPRLAAQLFYMEMGFVAYLVAGIWASWGVLVFTYMHLALVHVTSRLLKEESTSDVPQRTQHNRGARRPGQVQLRRGSLA